MSRRTAPLAGLLAALALAALPAAAGARALSVTAAPGLFPGFRSSVTDYVSRCARRPLAITARAGKGWKLQLPGQKARTGSVTGSYTLPAGRGIVFSARRGKRKRTYHVRCLPDDFPVWTASRHGKPQGNLYLVTPTINFTQQHPQYVIIFDTHGVPLWWARGSATPSDAQLLPNGRIAWAAWPHVEAFSTDPSARYEEHTLTGALVRTWQTVGSPTDVHDYRVLPNGNRILMTYRVRDGVDLYPHIAQHTNTVVDGELQEFTPAGKLVWSWNTKDHIPYDDVMDAWWPLVGLGAVTLPDGRKVYDPLHINSVDVHGRYALISSRHADATYLIDRKSGSIVWKLGGRQRANSLRIGSDPRGGTNGQHDARLLPNGDVTIYDNSTLGSMRPRAVRYHLNLRKRTATLVDQIEEPLVTRSQFIGSSRRLEGGDYVVNWGGNPIFGEYTPSGKRRLLIVFAGRLISYRAVAIEHGLSRAELRRAMDAMPAG